MDCCLLAAVLAQDFSATKFEMPVFSPKKMPTVKKKSLALPKPTSHPAGLVNLKLAFCPHLLDNTPTILLPVSSGLLLRIIFK